MSLDACPRCGRSLGGGKFCPGCGNRIDDPLSGKVLGGRYTLAAVLGRGPFFTTWSTEPRAGSGLLLVKVLADGPAADPERRRRFLENAGASLTFPAGGLLPVREMAEEAVAGIPARVVYAVTDGARGPSLAELVARGGPLAPARAAALAADLLETLGRLHGAGGVHGDLHPGCLFVEDGDRVRVGDAGLAAGLAPKGAEDPAALGSDGGRWIAPEQASGGKVGPPADLHAAGALLHFLLTGYPPWQASGGPPLLFEIQRSFPRPPSEVRPGLPAALDEVVDRALAKGPADRFPSAAEFLRALRSAAAGLPSGTARATSSFESDASLGVAPAVGGDTATMAAPLVRGDDATLQGPLAVPGASGDETIAAPRRPAPAPSGDETLHAPRAVTPPRKGPPPKPPEPAKAGRKAPPARPAAPPPAGDRTLAAPRPPAPAPAPAGSPPAASPAPGAPAAAGKPKGPWTVGTPVAVFALLLFLGTGGLYAAVWAGTLDWSIPPWLRVLTGRHEIPHNTERNRIPDRPVWPLTLRLPLPAEVAFPVEGEGPDALFGTWTLERIPPSAAVNGSGEEPDTAEPAPRRLFASGEFRGPPPEGVYAVTLNVPAGRFVLRASFRYGDAGGSVDVKDAPRTERFEVLRRPTVLHVKVRQELGQVSAAHGFGEPARKPVTKGTGIVAFGLVEDGADDRLLYGDDVVVRVEAEGYRSDERRVRLLDNPHVVEFDLQEDAGNKVSIALEDIKKRGSLSARYENDPVVLGDPSVKIALARVCMKQGAWAKVDEYVDDLRSGADAGPMPEGARDLFLGWHEHLRKVAAEAAAAGDVWRVRESRARTRPEVLGERDAESERARWAELEIQAWRNYPPSVPLPERAEGEGREELSAVERMVAEDLKLVFPEVRERLQREVASDILLRRAWPAWNRGTETAAPRALDGPPAVPGPDVSAWLALARKAWPGIEDTIDYQRLQARLEDQRAAPDRVVGWLFGDRTWTPDRATPKARIDTLTKRDRLLLARALAWWGDLRRKDAAERDAMALWQGAWNVYQTIFEPEGETFPREMAEAALLEGARMALLTRGNETALEVVQRYLALQGGDREAGRLRDALLAKFTLQPPAKMEELGYRTLPVPGGRFRVGAEEPRAAVDESPFPDGTAVKVRVLPARDVLLEDFLVGMREVTVAQYRRYAAAMADPAMAAKFAHPDEPESKKAPGARDLLPGSSLSPDEPVRGVDWWDAWACARFLGGRLPTEAEWEKAARWSGGLRAPEDPLPWWRRTVGAQWPGFWPDNGIDISPFDVAPCGARGFLGGAAEWTMDPFDSLPSGVPEGVAVGVAVVPPVLAKGPETFMAVRGGSFFHQAPGEAPGPSAAERKEPPPAPVEGAAPPPPAPPRTWRAMDLLERRGVAAGRRAKWIGFRVVVGSAGSERPR